MRTAFRTSLPLGARALVALLLAGTFGFRVVASPAAWGCTMAQQAADGREQPTGHRHSQPADHRSHLPTCECVAHATATGLTVRPLELESASLLPAPVRVVLAGRGIQMVHFAPHLLPFSVGPPSRSLV